MGESKLVPVVGGLGIGSLALWLLLRKKKPVLPEPPENGVVVGLWNPPKEANKWQMRIVDDVGLKTLVWGVDEHDNIEDAAVFELSPEWLFPLAVDISVYQEWQEDGEWHARQLHYVQSLHPYLWDFETGEWSDEPDPSYREVFIPAYGSYYYNVTKGWFEK